MKILTLTLNPALDKTIYTEKPFKLGELNRTDSSIVAAGGKGINVSRLLSALGIETTAYTFFGGINGMIMKSMLKADGIKTFVVETKAETRMNIKIIDGNEICTEANESGGPISDFELTQMMDSVMKDTDNTQYFVMCGSIPHGVDKAVYNLLATLLKRCGIRTVIDCDGDAFCIGVESLPFMIKPNVFELSQYLGTEISTKEKAVEACHCLYVQKGVNILCTLGENGSIYAGEQGIYTADSPHVKVRGFSGAGDTFLAAFLSKYDSVGAGEALRYASSAAAAKVETPGTAFPDSSQLGKYTDIIEIIKVI